MNDAPEVEAKELIDALTGEIAHLVRELAAARIIIAKLNQRGEL